MSCDHKWHFQETQQKLSTEADGQWNYTAKYHRVDMYFCEKCCELKKVEQVQFERLPFGGIRNPKKYAPVWFTEGD